MQIVLINAVYVGTLSGKVLILNISLQNMISDDLQKSFIAKGGFFCFSQIRQSSHTRDQRPKKSSRAQS